MVTFTAEVLTGVQLDIEHIDCRGDGYDISWMVVINLGIVRVVFTKYEADDEE